MGDDSHPLLAAIRFELLAAQQRLEVREPSPGELRQAPERGTPVPVFSGAADAPPVVAPLPCARVDREVPLTLVTEPPRGTAGG
jgi:hypothetical protein